MGVQHRSCGSGGTGSTAAARVAGARLRGGASPEFTEFGASVIKSRGGLAEEHVRGMGNLPSASARGCSGQNGARGGEGGAVAANSPACAFGHLKGATAYENLHRRESGVCGRSATRSSGGSWVALAEEGVAGVLRASGLHGELRDRAAKPVVGSRRSSGQRRRGIATAARSHLS